MTVIFCLSHEPATESSQTSSGFSEILANFLYSDFETLSHAKQESILSSCQFVVRKSAHFCIYGLLGILTFTACKFSDFKFMHLVAAGICLLYSISDEIHQYFIEGRSCELRDVFIDFSGSTLGIIGMTIIFVIINKIYKRKEKKI